MQKFMLIIREDLNRLKKQNEEGRHQGIRTMMHWVESLGVSGNYQGGDALLIQGKYVSRNEVLSDGPFVEAKEGISGYMILHAENIEQAAAIAQTCPLVQQDLMVIEVRPVLTVNHTLLHG